MRGGVTPETCICDRALHNRTLRAYFYLRYSLAFTYSVYLSDVFNNHCHRKRMTATEALRHSFVNLANHRGLGDKINLDNLRAYLFRRKIEVRVIKQWTVTIRSPEACAITCLSGAWFWWNLSFPRTACLTNQWFRSVYIAAILEMLYSLCFEILREPYNTVDTS